MLRKLIAASVTVAAFFTLAALPASAGEGQCGPQLTTCPTVGAALRIDTRGPGESRLVLVTVTATNTNPNTNIGAFDAKLVVTYQTGINAELIKGYGATEHTILLTLVPDGGSYSATFPVRQRKFLDGIVRARIVDVGCDRVNETVSLAFA